MAKRPGSEERLTMLLSAAVGAILGIILPTIYHVLHDHSDLTAEEVIWDHFLPEMLAAMAGGAIVLGGVAVILTRLKRHS